VVISVKVGLLSAWISRPILLWSLRLDSVATCATVCCYIL